MALCSIAHRAACSPAADDRCDTLFAPTSTARDAGERWRRMRRGPIAQRQSSRLITDQSQVRSLLGPPQAISWVLSCDVISRAPQPSAVIRNYLRLAAELARIWRGVPLLSEW
jgi:hypothetical protein